MTSTNSANPLHVHGSCSSCRPGACSFVGIGGVLSEFQSMDMKTMTTNLTDFTTRCSWVNKVKMFPGTFESKKQDTSLKPNVKERRLWRPYEDLELLDLRLQIDPCPKFEGSKRVVAGDKSFKCNQPGCGKTFARNEELTRHKRIHSGERPHHCQVCWKNFGRKDHLTKHQKTHLNASERMSYVCRVEGCEKRYTRSDALTRHQWTVHNIKWKQTRHYSTS